MSIEFPDLEPTVTGTTSAIGRLKKRGYLTISVGLKTTDAQSNLSGKRAILRKRDRAFIGGDRSSRNGPTTRE